MDEFLPMFVVAAAPGLVITFTGIMVILLAPKDARAARLRGARLNAIGFGVFILGLALALAWVGIKDEAWVLVGFAIVVMGPQVAFFLRMARGMRLSGE